MDLRHPFVIVFAETGLVVTPFLPGDSLLFIAGSIAAMGAWMCTWWFLVLFAAAAWVIRQLREVTAGLSANAIHQRSSRWLNPEYLAKTHTFFEKWGPAAVVIALVPFLRTYVPFVAGLGEMSRPSTWLHLFRCGHVGGSLVYSQGYLFGNIPWIKAEPRPASPRHHFSKSVAGDFRLHQRKMTAGCGFAKGGRARVRPNPAAKKNTTPNTHSAIASPRAGPVSAKVRVAPSAT